MKNNKRESYSSTTKIVSKEECERKIFERFQSLNDDKTIHNYFCSYDFHYHENDILEFWKDVLIFLYEGVFNTFAINVNEILEKTKLRNRRPIGLPNIILELVNKGVFILSTSIKGDEYFKKNYPNLYRETWSSWIRNGVILTIKKPFNYLTSDPNTVKDNFKPEDLLIYKRYFHHHLEGIINLLISIQMQEDVEVFTKFELIEYLNQSDLSFKSLYLDLSLEYLSKIKKIELFKVRLDNVDIECIKLLRDENSTVSEKDKAIINISAQIRKFDKRLEETSTVVEDCLAKAKLCLKTKNRESALNWMKKKNIYQKAYHHYSNLKHTLEQNLLDIKSMESNLNVKDILESVVKSSEELKINIKDFDKITDQLQKNKENLYEAKDILNEIHDENINNISIDNELELLTEQINHDKNRYSKKNIHQENIDQNIFSDDVIYPDVNNKKSIRASELQNNRSVNINLNNSLEEMLQELQK